MSYAAATEARPPVRRPLPNDSALNDRPESTGAEARVLLLEPTERVACPVPRCCRNCATTSRRDTSWNSRTRTHVIGGPPANTRSHTRALEPGGQSTQLSTHSRFRSSSVAPPLFSSASCTIMIGLSPSAV